MLVFGGFRNNHSNGFVLVLDTEAMGCEQTLFLDWPVDPLLSLRGKVWGALSRKDGSTNRVDKVAVWGNVERGAGASEAGSS